MRWATSSLGAAIAAVLGLARLARGQSGAGLNADESPVDFLAKYAQLASPTTKSGEGSDRVRRPCDGQHLASDGALGINSLAGPSKCPVGEKVAVGDWLEVLYVAHSYDKCDLIDMTASDESYQFQMGRRDVVEGWEKGLLGACAGQTRRLSIPSNMAYGDEGMNIEGAFEVAGGSSLIYTIQVLSVRKDELPGGEVEQDPVVREKLKKLERKEKHGFKVVAPRNSKHREKNMLKTNHPKAKAGLNKKRRALAEREVRKEVRKRRLGGVGSDL